MLTLLVVLIVAAIIIAILSTFQPVPLSIAVILLGIAEFVHIYGAH